VDVFRDMCTTSRLQYIAVIFNFITLISLFLCAMLSLRIIHESRTQNVVSARLPIVTCCWRVTTVDSAICRVII